MAYLVYFLHKEHKNFRYEKELSVDDGKEKFFLYKPHCLSIKLLDNNGEPILSHEERQKRRGMRRLRA